MILKDLLAYFAIEVNLPDYLYSQPLNDVFKQGILTKSDGGYIISVKTQKDVTHTLFINPDDDYPVAVSSLLSNGRTNGMKFGRCKGDLIYI